MTEHKNVLSPAMGLLNPAKAPEAAVTNADLAREFTIAAQNTENGSIMFHVELSPNVLLDRTVFIRYFLTVTINKTAGNAVTYDGTTFCLAQYPLHRVMKSIDVKLNNSSKSVEPHIWHNAIMKYDGDYLERRSASMCPTQPDNHNNLRRMQQCADAYDSPFKEMASAGTEVSRQCFPITTSARNAGNNILTLTYEITEPLHHPFFSNSLEMKQLANIRNMDINITFLQSLVGMVTAVLLTPANPSVTVDFTPNTQAQLLLRTYVPTVNIPTVLKMPYEELIIRRFPFEMQCLANAHTAQVTTNDIVLSQVPHRIYIFARPTADLATPVPDAFAVIKSMIFRTDQNSGGLSNATQQQLYQMCVRNGLNEPYHKFVRDVGSVVCLDLSMSNIGAVIPGTRMPFSFNLKIDFENTTAPAYDPNTGLLAYAGAAVDYRDETTEWTLFMVAIMEGHMIADGTSLSLSTGSSEQELVEALRKGIDPAATPEDAKVNPLASAGSFKSLTRGIVKHYVKPLIHTAGRAAVNAGKEFALQKLTGQGFRLTG